MTINHLATLRIIHELMRNYPETNERDNSQDSQEDNSRNSRKIDLSGISQTDDAQAKLDALSAKIDQLSADPDYDGVFFSPTVTFKQLHLSFDPVKAIFQQKLKEGKLSKKKRYKIRHKAVE